MIRSPFRSSAIPRGTSIISRGFTLIELLVVIAIIGMLSSISFYSVAEARVKATNARVLSEVRAFTNIIEAHKASTGEYPLTSGIVCFGGTDCGTDSSVVLNAELEKSGAIGANPMRDKVAFNTDGVKTFKAWYARCSDVSGYCEDDDIAEIVWYLEGSTADCGSGARKFVSDSEGNTACVYKLSGIGTVINQAALGFETGGPDVEYCLDAGACNYEAMGDCDYSCIVQCTDTGACNYGASETCDYSCLCNEPSACNYSGSSNGSYEVCDFSCHTTCTDTNACNYGSMGSCSYDCCTDSNACNYLQQGQPYCDYSCIGTTCNDSSACNYGSYGECDYTSCQVYCGDLSACNYGYPNVCEYTSCTGTTCGDSNACNYGSYGDCDYSCNCSYDGSACNYNWNGTGSCDYSCQTPYCGDSGACNYGSEGECDYSCY